MWEFMDVRQVAIKELGALEMDPVHKIVTQMRYDIEREWSLEAFDALCRRSEPLEIDEGERLGVEVLAKVASTREKLSATWTKPKNIVRKAWLPSTHGVPVSVIFVDLRIVAELRSRPDDFHLTTQVYLYRLK